MHGNSIDMTTHYNKTQGYLLKRETTLNEMKRTEITYNEQETTWNNLQQAGNNLKRTTTSKLKQPETN